MRPSAAGLALDAEVVAVLDGRLPLVAEQSVAMITAEVPEYARALTGDMGQTIELAVRTALGAFLRLAEQTRDADPGTPLQPALEGAYALGRGEARSGRSVDALLAAYRLGARVAWREFSEVTVAHGVPGPVIAQFAELVFAYIDQLSASSVSGHTDELATSGRVRQQYLERLGAVLLEGAAEEELLAAAERADWPVPRTLTAVLLPSAQVRSVLAALDPRTLVLTGDLAGLAAATTLAVLLVPDADGTAREHLLRVLSGRSAVVGPLRRWSRAASSSARAVRALPLLRGTGPVDTEEHLAELVLGADPEALADLRRRVLAPLDGLKPGVAERLAETLRSWLLHQGRRDEVAAELVVHPQTVRYRMTQLRELYGERLGDPDQVLALIVALAVPLVPAVPER